jgi:hypothetical protein
MARTFPLLPQQGTRMSMGTAKRQNLHSHSSSHTPLQSGGNIFLVLSGSLCQEIFSYNIGEFEMGLLCVSLRDILKDDMRERKILEAEWVRKATYNYQRAVVACGRWRTDHTISLTIFWPDVGDAFAEIGLMYACLMNLFMLRGSKPSEEEALEYAYVVFFCRLLKGVVTPAVILDTIISDETDTDTVLSLCRDPAMDVNVRKANYLLFDHWGHVGLQHNLARTFILENEDNGASDVW